MTKCLSDGKVAVLCSPGCRPVFTQEFLGEREQPTFEEVLNLIPEYKRIVLEVK